MHLGGRFRDASLGIKGCIPDPQYWSHIVWYGSIRQCPQLWSELAGLGPNSDFFGKIGPKKV